MHSYIGAYTPDDQAPHGPEDSMPLDAAIQKLPLVRLTPVAESRPLDPRTRLLLEAPIAATLLRLAWPNIAVMLAQASVGLIETWWVSRLGIDALAGLALVFPGFMLMQMLSAGAMGGGISSSIARALGGGRRDDADALVLHAIIINVAIGSVFSALVLGFGPSFYRTLGGEGASLEAALLYSNVVFAGAGIAVVSTTALTTVVLASYIATRRSVVRFARSRLRWALFADILRVGAVASVTTLQTALTVVLATALIGSAGGGNAIAGYGTGVRLEYLLVPLVFGLGASLVALVGTNIGAGQHARALRVALTGGAIAFGLSEAIGIAAALWPAAWLGLFSDDPGMLATGAQYLRIVGPAYGFFGLGLALYFASQGAGRLLWPLLAGLVRLAIAVGGGWVALRLTGSLGGLFAALALGLIAYGVILSPAVGSGAWFRRKASA